MTQILDDIEAGIKDRRDAHESEWWKLVREIANGKKPSVEAVDHLLKASGKTTDELRKSVALIQKRIQAFASIQRAAEIANRRGCIRRRDGLPITPERMPIP